MQALERVTAGQNSVSVKTALREILKAARFDGGFGVGALLGYTRQFERQRLDEDSGMAWLSGVAKRDR